MVVIFARLRGAAIEHKHMQINRVSYRNSSCEFDYNPRSSRLRFEKSYDDNMSTWLIF